MRPRTADLEHGVFKLATNDPTKPKLNTTFANMYRIQACVAPLIYLPCNIYTVYRDKRKNVIGKNRKWSKHD